MPLVRNLSCGNPFTYSLLRRRLSASASPSAVRRERILHPAGQLYQQRRRPPTMSFDDFRLSYQTLSPGQSCPEQSVVQNGRVLRKRESGRSLFFLDVACGVGSLQVKCSSKEFESSDLFDLARSVTRGDYISIQGFPTSSSKGQLLLCARDCQILAPCLHPIPDALESPEIRQRQRYLDMIVNANNVHHIFRTRAKVISFIRRFLEKENFVEVETPILWGSAGGANANPFTTNSSALSSELHLRIAPELFLKQLIIGGLDRVFELGKVFRNEGMDREHHPEFTSCEFYMAHADYLDLIPLTERLLTGITEMLGDQSKIRFESFDRLDCLTALNDELSKLLDSQINIVELLDEDERSVSELKTILLAANLPLPKHVNATSIVDSLISNLVEPRCVNPTFLMNHPTLVSPLAKAHLDRPYITERFELFIQGQEICNAYSELADPDEQRRRFQHQEMLRSQGDTEKRPCSDEFCEALEFGMPPTAGWGIGLDRLCRLLTGASHIRDVILFPALRPKHDKN